MSKHEIPYGYTREMRNVTFERAVERITDALKKEGFGVLTRIDVQDTLKEKIGVDFHRYLILGACNPHLAHRALGAEPGVGLLLPCNVTIFDGDPGEVVVQAIRPQALFEDVVKKAGLAPIVEEADAKLRRALEAA
jgi:uncharacterized protein (DUF302 family)